MFACLFCHFVHNLYQLYHTLLQLTYKCHCSSFRKVALQFLQCLVVVVSNHTELSMEIAPLGLAALHSKELGIVFMSAFVKCHHMKRLAKNSRLDECGLACHARTVKHP